MIKRILANFILWLHVLFVVVAVFGAFGILISSRWVWIHIPVVIWSAVVNIAGWTCPLTPMEKRLRVAGGGEKYEGGFLNHYLGPLLSSAGSPRRLEITIGVAVLLWNAILYGAIYWWLYRGA